MIRTVLFATDLGAYSPVLLEHVALIAGQHSAEIVVLHAVEPFTHIADALVQTYLPQDAKRELEEEGIERILQGIKQGIIDALEEDLFEGSEGLAYVREVLVERGAPAKLILQTAQYYGADLIILGSHGPNSSNPNMLGSVASKILQLSTIPVYMVPLMRSAI